MKKPDIRNLKKGQYFVKAPKHVVVELTRRKEKGFETGKITLEEIISLFPFGIYEEKVFGKKLQINTKEK